MNDESEETFWTTGNVVAWAYLIAFVGYAVACWLVGNE